MNTEPDITNITSIILNGLGELATSIFTNPVMLFGLAVIIFFGYFLKMFPGYPNKHIPFGVVTFGILYYSFGINPSAAPPYNLHPQVTLGAIGLMMGIISLIIHNKVLKKYIDDKVFKEENGGTDTTIITKDDIKG